MSKIPVYMMPGLGANPSIFEYIKLPDKYEIYWMHWIIPEQDEKLPDYVSRLMLQIKHEQPVLLGVSFGGIVIQEIAKQMAVRKLVLISTVKTHREFPDFFEKALRYKLYKFFPSRALSYVDLLEKVAFIKSFKQKMKLYQKYMDVNEPRYVDWAIKAVLHWQQEVPPKEFVHIHGDKDLVFPFKKIKSPVVKIEGGTHAMIVYRFRWFNRKLPELIEGI